MLSLTLEEFFQSYMTIAEARQRLGVSRQRLAQLCQRGQLPGALHHGRQWWIPRDSVEARRKKMLRLQRAKRRKSSQDKDLQP